MMTLFDEFSFSLIMHARSISLSKTNLKTTLVSFMQCEIKIVVWEEWMFIDKWNLW